MANSGSMATTRRRTSAAFACSTWSRSSFQASSSKWRTFADLVVNGSTAVFGSLFWPPEETTPSPATTKMSNPDVLRFILVSPQLVSPQNVALFDGQFAVHLQHLYVFGQRIK